MYVYNTVIVSASLMSIESIIKFQETQPDIARNNKHVSTAVNNKTRPI